MNADDFRDYMLSFLFLRYLSGNYEESAKKELGADYPQLSNSETNTPLAIPVFQNLDLSLKKAHQMPSKKICFQCS
jgi:type I restriction enzyme M protein